MNIDLLSPGVLVYVAHILFWVSFGFTRALLPKPPSPATPVPASPEREAPHSRALIAFHMVAFAVMYAGIGGAVIPHRIPALLPYQRGMGVAVIALGAGIACWALVHFASWRFRAALTQDHQLATGGPFAFVRHPIYLALDLLALGSAIYVPAPLVWIGFVLMVIGSDLRGRAEEKLLTEAFGDRYRDYMSRTARFVPGIY